MKLEDILKNNQQQYEVYGTSMGGQVGPATNTQQTFEPRMPEGLLDRPIDGIMGGQVGPDMQQMRQSLGSNFTEQEAMRDMQMRQLRESLGGNFTEQEIMRLLQG